MTEVLIVGGGVCGTRLAGQLTAAGVAVVLAEARGELGGRVRTRRYDDPVGYADLGPAWVWPHQPRVLALLRALELPVFEQHTAGQLVFQDERGAIRRFDMATMGGSLRIEGGMQRLVDALAADLDPGQCRLGAHLETLTLTETGVLAGFADGTAIEARTVVLALPPRVAAQHVVFEPGLPTPLRDAMSEVPTWMAGHAKAIALYETPWWRERGLNGDAMSHCGPLGELHDASPHDLSCGALFGFFAQPAPWRRTHRSDLHDRVRAQLGVLFGPEAARPRRLEILDWADDARVAVQADDALLREHPRYGPLNEDLGAWGGRLVLSGTELAPSEGGFVEGALAAADHAASQLTAGARSR